MFVAKAKVVEEDTGSKSRLRIGLVMLVIILLVLADQLSKRLVLANLFEGQIVPVIPGFFNLTLHFNEGVAFGLLANMADKPRKLILTVTTALALSCVIYFLLKRYFDDWLGQMSLALIIGGALGNIVDRLVLGKVIDFLDFYVLSYHWPAFNVADSSICLGVFILLCKGSDGPKK